MPNVPFTRRTCRSCQKPKFGRDFTGPSGKLGICIACRRYRHHLEALEKHAKRERRRIKIGKRRQREALEYEQTAWQALQRIMAEHQRITDLYESAKAKRNPQQKSSPLRHAA